MRQTGSCRRGGVRGEWWKEEERISQRTCMSDPWTWTMAWGRLWERGLDWAEEDKGGKIGTTAIE